MNSLLSLLLLTSFAPLYAAQACPEVNRAELDKLLKEREKTNVYFFASWCGECSKNLKNATAEDVVIATFDTQKSAEKVINVMDVKARCFTDNGVADSYGIKGVPAKIVYEGKKTPEDKSNSLALAFDKNYTHQSLNFKLVKIIQDSRCPAEVVCVWAGNVTAMVEVSSDKLKKSYTFEIPGPAVEAKDFGLSLLAVGIKPPRLKKQKIAEKDYELELQIK